MRKKFERQPKDTDIVLIDNEYAKVVVTGWDIGSDEDDEDLVVELYLVNRTEKTVEFQIDEISANDCMIDDVWYSQAIRPCKCAYDKLQISYKYFKDAHISVKDIEVIEFMLEESEPDIGSEPYIKEVLELQLERWWM